MAGAPAAAITDGRHLVPGVGELEGTVCDVGLSGTAGRVRVAWTFGHGLEHKTSSAACQSVGGVPPFSTMTTMTTMLGAPPTVRRTQAERRETTRTKLLDAAVECLTERGYAATSVVDVQQRAGVSRGAAERATGHRAPPWWWTP